MPPAKRKAAIICLPRLSRFGRIDARANIASARYSVPTVAPHTTNKAHTVRPMRLMFNWKRDALARHGKPDIFNTDQGSQFTGAAFTGVLANNDIAISMDGKGAWRDNVFVERLWRSVKYEEVYLRAYDSVGEARASIGRYLDFYNGRRPHSSLDGTTPDQAYFTPLPIRMAA